MENQNNKFMPDKEFLLRDLCERLPYDTIVNIDNGKYREDTKLRPCHLADFNTWDVKPYLRPLSSMTKEEKEELEDICTMYNGGINTDWESFGIEILQTHPKYGDSFCQDFTAIDWLNAHHFDYRGLIPMGLALEAPEGIYNTFKSE